MSALPAFSLTHPLAEIVVVTRSEIVETQLRTRLEPYVRVDARSTASADHQEAPSLVVIAEPESAPIPQGLPTEVMIRNDEQFERYRRPADLWKFPHENVMHERKNGSLFRWGTELPARIVVANNDSVALAKSVRRLVQDFIRLRVWHLGGIIVEASTVSVDGLGLFAVGGRGLGKTTLLARFLGIGAGMVSNDEVALFPTKEGVVAHGIPMLVNVRPPLVERFPQLHDIAHFTLDGIDRKAPVPYDSFAHALGGRIAASADNLVGVLLSPDRESARDVNPETLCSALTANILSGPGWATPWRLLPPGFAEPDPIELERRIAHIVDQVPAMAIGRLNAPTDIAHAARSRLASRIA